MKETKGILGWATADRLTQGVLAFAFQIALARLLTPHDFGLVALTAVFIAVATSVADAGFANALVQKQEASDEDCSSVFYFNLGVGVLSAGMLLAAAPAVAALFGERELAPVLAALTLRIVIGMAGSVPVGLLTRRLEFRRIFLMNTPAQILGGSVGIIAAMHNFGVWSLVAQTLVVCCVSTALAFLFSAWRPCRLFSWAALGRMAPYGVRVFTAGVVDQVFGNLYQLVIGWLASATAVGLYARASSLQHFPVANISTVLAGISFPLLSRRQGFPAEMKAATRGVMLLAGFAGFPAMCGMLVVAEPLVLVLLGDQWRDCIPYLRVLSLTGLLYPLSAVNVAVLKAAGRADLFLRVEMAKKLIVLVALAVTVPLGILPMLWGGVACGAVCYWLNTRMTARVVDYGFRAQMTDLVPILLMAAGMAAGVHLVVGLPLPVLMQLIVGVVAGALLFISMIHLWLKATQRDWRSLLGLVSPVSTVKAGA